MMALKCDNCGGYFDFDSATCNIIRIARAHPKSRTPICHISMGVCPECINAVMKTLEDRKEAFNEHDCIEM